MEGVPQGTYPPLAKVPTPLADQDWGRGYPKVPTPRPRYLPPSQVRMGGGVPQGTYPTPARDLLHGERYASCVHAGLSYYTASGMPLAFTQEDFLIKLKFSLQ